MRLVLLEEVGLHGGGGDAGEVTLTWETNHEDITCLLPCFPSLASCCGQALHRKHPLISRDSLLLRGSRVVDTLLTELMD